eukprot:7383020-Pyramimonas_sp.AAC.1
MIRKARGLTLMDDNASIKEWRKLNERPQRHGGLERKRHCMCQPRSNHIRHVAMKIALILPCASS